MEREIELQRAADVVEQDRRRLAEMGNEVDWGTPVGLAPLQFGGPPDWRVLVRENRQVVSTVEILERRVLVNDTPLLVAGISGVMTTAPYQGRGHASAAMRQAADFLNRERSMLFALLVCWPSRRPFYERLGWRVHNGTVLCDQPGGRMSIDQMHVMVLDGTACPARGGQIDLQGLPW